MKETMSFTIKINRSYNPFLVAVGVIHGRFGLVLGPLAIHAGFVRDSWA